MIVWLKKTDGSCVRLTDPWKPKIHIGGSYRDLLELACRPGLENAIFVEMYEKAGDRERSRVLEIEVDGDREAVGLARKLEQVGRYSKFRFYDIDIPSPQMYLYRKGLFPLALVEAEETSRGVNWTLKDSRESIDYQLPPLREIELQIKTEKIRKVRSFEDKIASVTFTRDEKETLTIDSGDEVDKILGIVETFRAEDPDVIITHGGDSFIFPYLARRAQEHGILDQLMLGRDISPLRVYEVQGHSYFSYGKILYRETAARLLGRLHVDQRNAYVSADCGLEGLFEVSRTCIMPIQRASRATIGTNMTSLQLYHAVKRDVLIPWNKNQPEELKNSGELVTADRGGFIYEPQIGIHDHVGELDFACLAKNSVVETRKGRKYVVDVTEYDEVFTPFGWQRVSTVHKYRIKSKVFRLTLEDGKTLTCTARHKFPVLIKDSFKERRSNDIRRGSRLIVADILQVFQENELACIFGAFTAEGSSIRSDYQYFDKVRNKKRISHQYKIEFDIGEHETDFRDFIVNTLSRIYPGIHFYERRKKGERALSISISQKAIVNDFLSKYNSFIANHYLTLDEKASFLRGFFEGDGGVNTRRNTIQCNQSFVNTEKLEIVCNYLRELNIKNRVGTYKYAYSTNPTLFLELSGLEAHVRYYTQVGFISKNKEEKLRQIMLTRIRKAQHYNNPRFGVYLKARKNNALSFLREVRVINKEILDYDDYVYDITLEWEEFPYYFANGILTHNSLYPTLMTRMNLSGETVNCTCCPDSANRVPELEFNICERSAGIVPLSLKILLDKRARYKVAKKTVVDEELKTLYDQRQAALKWILVCCLPPESPVLISRNGRVSYEQIGEIIDQLLGENVGVFDCPQELFVAGVDKNLRSKFCRVSKLIKTPSPEKLLRVRMDDGRQVECTPNHSFYVLRNGHLVEINAEKLSKGDLVPVAKGIVHNATVSRLDLLERVRQEIGQTENDLWRAKSDSLQSVVSSSSNTLQFALKKERRHIHSSRLRDAHSRIMNLLDSDIGFVAVKKIEQIESSSPFVYCFEISNDENFPAFFTGSGGVLVHNSFGYLGFKNARFGKIDAHIATCAFSRQVLGQAAALAEARGFKLVHGIVDSFWLRKHEATRSEYEDLCRIIREELRLPISFEGIYKWIVFLSSKTDSKVGVLNRYYGIFEDGTLKVRGIDLRRHDTPDIVRQCQTEMLDILTRARDSNEFRLLIPSALKILEKFVSSLRDGSVPLEDLVIVRNLSKNPDEYSHQVPQAIAARHLVAHGGSVHAGQQVSYILTNDQTRTAVPPEIVDQGTVYDSERYVDLLCSSTANLLLPLGYDTKYLRSMFKTTEMKRPTAHQRPFS